MEQKGFGTDVFRPFKPDAYGDRVPDEVYDAIAKSIIERGYGDLAIYRAFNALSEAWPGEDS